jgi:hypothetical protein
MSALQAEARLLRGRDGRLPRPRLEELELAAALDRLAADAAGLPVVSAALAALRGEPDLAWRSLALALLADELADE